MVHAVSVDYEHSPFVNKTVLENVQCSHGFIATVLEAYNRHQHLRITPDDVWLTIAQGVSQHVNLNVNKYRHFFVHNKQKISINANGIFDSERWSRRIVGDWPECVRLLAEKADKKVEKINLMKLLECDYSTSTITTTTASRVVLLNSLETISQTQIDWTCGIPKVTLEGTLGDWSRIQEKINILRSLPLDLDFWFDRLEPIIWQLIATYQGKVNERFWKRIAHRLGGCGYAPHTNSTLNGWITAFLPYDRHGNALIGSSIDECDLPDGKVVIPFNVKGYTSLKLISGFLGVRQDIIEESGELVVSPVIGWAVVEDKSKTKPRFWKFFQ
ncbi:3049_t:CDS:1 [Funneliformis mosseae]|uniref:3049_t:CDS:1 n=2 Tax=Funneliformis TaxID=1117308 RepID=A0A9N9G9G7_FUNMO|nr:3049_t:CDS:1 [Funneliformis mosseae]